MLCDLTKQAWNQFGGKKQDFGPVRVSDTREDSNSLRSSGVGAGGNLYEF